MKTKLSSPWVANMYQYGNAPLKKCVSLRLASFVCALCIGLVTSGCVSVAELLEMDEFPRDTAVSIGNYNYVINTIKCHEVRNIGEDGDLECYAADGSKSAPVSPQGEWLMEQFDKYHDYEWGSEEHQAFLYEFHYLGGKERLANSMLQTVQATASLVQTTQQIMNSTNYNAATSSSSMPVYGANPALNGMNVWEAREFSMADWHFNNLTYFTLDNGLSYGQGGILSQRTGMITQQSNGIYSYQFGDSTYHSNGAVTRQVTDNISFTNNGTICTQITGSITRCSRN